MVVGFGFQTADGVIQWRKHSFNPPRSSLAYYRQLQIVNRNFKRYSYHPKRKFQGEHKVLTFN